MGSNNKIKIILNIIQFDSGETTYEAAAHRLAEYMLYLKKNETAYAEYFWWKDFFSVEWDDGICNLCEYFGHHSK